MQRKGLCAVIGCVAALAVAGTWAQGMQRASGDVARAQQLYAVGQKDEARGLLLEHIQAGHPEVLADYVTYRNWFCRPEAAELLVKALEELPREPRYGAQSGFWLNGARLILQLPVNDRLPAQEIQMRALLCRVLRVADDFSRVTPGVAELAQNRPYINELARVLVSLRRYQDAYDLLWQAVFGDGASDLPRADGDSLFFMTQWDLRLSEYYPSTQLIRLARNLGKLDELRQAVVAHRQQEPAWDDIGLHLLALIDIERGDDAAANAELSEIAQRPAPQTALGCDPSLDILAARAAQRPALATWNATLLGKMVGQSTSAKTGPIVTIDAFTLARSLLATGQKDKAEEALRQATRLLSPWMGRAASAEGDDDPLALSRADVWARAGYWREMVAAYRPILKHPLVTEDNLTEPLTGLYRRRSAAAADVCQALQKISGTGELEAYADDLRLEWQRLRAGEPGKRDCLPLILFASCQMLRGDYAAGRSALGELEERDNPAGLALLFECLANSPNPPEGLPVLESVFVRWPYLFSNQGADIAATYLEAQRTLPLGEALDPHLEGLDGEKRDHTLQVLRAMLEQYFLERGPDSTYAAWVEWLWRRFGVQDYAYPWLAWLVEEDADRAYETAIKLLTLDVQAEEGLAPLTLDRVFEPARELRWLKFNPYGSEECRVPPRTLALVIVEAARRAGRLAEFVGRCEDVCRGAAHDARQWGLAGRLQLQALTLLDPARAATLLPAFLAGEERFARATAGDPAWTAIREACWHVPELRSAALQIAHQQIELDRQAVSTKRSADLKRVTWPDYTLRYRVAEMELAGGHTDAGLDVVREVLRDMVANVDESLAQSGLDLSGARPVALRMLARKFGRQREALQMLQELRATVPDHPRLCRLFEVVENDLRDDLGETVAPGIVLAVQPAPRSRLQFIWQINRRTLPNPPEALVDDVSAEFQPPVRRAQFVKFWEPERAVSPDSYDVRLEWSLDGRTFQPLWTGPARGTEAPLAGASAIELDTESGILRWYRARLIRDRQVVATSATLAGITGDNLFATDLAAEEWGRTYGAGGRAAPVALARPGSTGFRGVHSLGTYQNARLDLRQTLPQLPERTYVLSGWAVNLPDELVDRSAPPAGQPLDRGVWGRLELLVGDDHDVALQRAEVKFNHSGAAVFGQMLLVPAPEDPPQEFVNWLSWYEGCGAGEGTLLSKRTRGLRLSLFVDSKSSLGDFYLEQAAPP